MKLLYASYNVQVVFFFYGDCWMLLDVDCTDAMRFTTVSINCLFFGLSLEGKCENLAKYHREHYIDDKKVCFLKCLEGALMWLRSKICNVNWRSN